MKNNEQWFQRLRVRIPWGSSTCSKAAKWMPDEPSVIVRGKGCRVWDADGREFIDFRNGLGPVTLGYQFPAVNEAIERQLKNGIVFGHPHPLEAEVAEILAECIPCAERVRFLKTGGEALSACIKLARYHTGRDFIIQIGYNGWLNSLASGGRSLPGMTVVEVPPGVPTALSALHHACGWNDCARLETLFSEHGDKIAALVIAANYERMEEGSSFYTFAHELTKKHGTVLIYDEIVTGFRVALAGVQEYFKVTPDMAVFAKGFANGMPLSVYCGKAEIMDKLDKAIVSSTYGGETLSLAAAKVTLETYKEKNVVAHLWRMGEQFCSGLNSLFQKHSLAMEIKGFPVCPIITFEPNAPKDLCERFFRSAYRHGVSLYNVPYVNFSHQESDICETLERLEEAIKSLKG
ncbi:MAG: aminotransferase class III-fold pyridoxal phosphate-dependent enzyme [Kiritimatiellae bacterium]|nr:aminotransferase class III-fold pyridoxal phosphate-dependent enzyme [Kiritimatiellia bacterium]